MEEIKKNELICKPLIQLNLFNKIYMGTDLCVIIYSTGLLQAYSFIKGDIKLEFTLFKRNLNDKIFLYKKNIFVLEGNIFKNLRDDKVISKFHFENDLKIHQYDKFLVIITSTFIYKYDLETINTDRSIKYSVLTLKSLQYIKNESLFLHSASGSVIMYYDKLQNSIIRNIFLKNRIEFISQKNNNSGFIKFENQPLKFFIIKNTILSTIELDKEEMFNFSSPTEKYLITPGKQKINFYNKSTLKKVKSFDCPIIEENSLIQCLSTGDILITVGNRVYLISKI